MMSGINHKGAFMGLGANYLMSSCCYAYAISEALRLPGFGPNYWMSSCCYEYAISDGIAIARLWGFGAAW